MGACRSHDIFGRLALAALVSRCGMSTDIEALFEETRRFPPPAEFASRAGASAAMYERADKDYVAFWAEWARKLEWMRPFTQTLEWNEPFARWFADGQLNVSVNCLDRHVAAGRGEKVAFYFEGEPGDRRTITYGNCSTTSAASPMRCARSAFARAIASRSTCR